MSAGGIDVDELAERLEEALAGRHVPGPHEGDVRALVNLASDVSGLVLPGPDEATRMRLSARFERTLERDRDSWWVGLVGWLGVGPAPRPFSQRLAAGLLFLTLSGGTASIVSGTSPYEAATAVADFAGSLVRNLDPRDSGGGPGVATPTPGTTATAEPSPGATADAGSPSATPDPNTTPSPGQTPTAEPTQSGGTPGTPSGTVTTVVTSPAATTTPGGPETETPGTSTPPPGAGTPTVPSASPTEDEDDFETETPDDGSDDNGGDIDRDDRTEPGDDRDSSDDDDSVSGSGGDDS